jgi:magnesium chelatase accessory protein
MSGRYPVWSDDGRDWPHHTASRFVETGGYRWHVQQMGPEDIAAPVCLLLHGTGAATHSWRGVMPLLARTHRVVAMDLPGHGFTEARRGGKVTLEGMSSSVAALLVTLDLTPNLIVGHSAGVAIGMQLMLDKGWRVPLVGFTPALMPFPGLAAKIFPSLAKILFTNPFVSIIFSRLARAPGEAAKFLRRSTGSRIDAAGETYYAHLFSKSGHCDGAIRMMANWRLESLGERFADVKSPVLLVYAGRDSAIPKSAVMAAAQRIPVCETREMPNLGHLAHEEDPEAAVEIVLEFEKAKVKL